MIPRLKKFFQESLSGVLDVKVELGCGGGVGDGVFGRRTCGRRRRWSRRRREERRLALVPLRRVHDRHPADLVLKAFDAPLDLLTNCCKDKQLLKYGGLQSKEVAHLLLTQQLQVQFSAFPKIYCNVGEIYQRHWLEESGQRLKNVDWTHLVLSSGKGVLQKIAEISLGSAGL